jgi:hypothetical protein
MEHAATVFLMCVCLSEQQAYREEIAGGERPEFGSDAKHAMSQHRSTPSASF